MQSRVLEAIYLWIRRQEDRFHKWIAGTKTIGVIGALISLSAHNRIEAVFGPENAQRLTNLVIGLLAIWLLWNLVSVIVSTLVGASPFQLALKAKGRQVEGYLEIRNLSIRATTFNLLLSEIQTTENIGDTKLHAVGLRIGESFAQDLWGYQRKTKPRNELDLRRNPMQMIEKWVAYDSGAGFGEFRILGKQKAGPTRTFQIILESPVSTEPGAVQTGCKDHFIGFYEGYITGCIQGLCGDRHKVSVVTSDAHTDSFSFSIRLDEA